MEKPDARLPYRDYFGHYDVVRLSDLGRTNVACATILWLCAVIDTGVAVTSGGLPLLACIYGVVGAFYCLRVDGQWRAFRRSLLPFWAFRRLVRRVLLAVLMLPASVYLHYEWEASWADWNKSNLRR